MSRAVDPKSVDGAVMRWLERAWIFGIPAYLLVFAFRFVDERLYADSGYYLVRVINEGAFHIEHGRWVLALPQLLPLLAVKLSAPLPAILLLHSIGNVALLVLGIAYALFVLKDRRTAVVLAAAHVIGLAHGLFCPVFELYYGVGLVLLFHATLTNDAMNGYQRMALSAAFFMGALSSHPMAWLLLLGSLALLDHRQRRPIFPILIVITFAFAVLRGLTMSVYESAQLQFIQRLAFPSLVLHRFAPDVLLEQASRVLRHYPDVLVLTVFSAVVLWRNDRRRAAALLLIGTLALYVLTGLYLPDATHDRYREQVDFAFTAWTLLVVLSRVWPIQRWRPALLILLVLCAGYRVAYVASIAPDYTKRTQWQLDHIATARSQHLTKAIIDPQGIAFGTVDDRVAPYWSTGIECLLLSAKDGPEHTVSIITTDDLACAGVPENLDKFVLRCWDVMDVAYLDRRYFALPARRYVPISAAAHRVGRTR